MSSRISLCFKHLECSDSAPFSITGTVELVSTDPMARRNDITAPPRYLANFTAPLEQLGVNCVMTCPLPGNNQITGVNKYVLRATCTTGGQTTQITFGFKFNSALGAGPIDIDNPAITVIP